MPYLPGNMQQMQIIFYKQIIQFIHTYYCSSNNLYVMRMYYIMGIDKLQSALTITIQLVVKVPYIKRKTENCSIHQKIDSLSVCMNNGRIYRRPCWKYGIKIGLQPHEGCPGLPQIGLCICHKLKDLSLQTSELMSKIQLLVVGTHKYVY